ncbi:MAG: hypothetical protein IPH12_14255 [Saprospirales bacterium]|nr:hypothetical protein [Saprospirales bacterium]MBK8924064.1 hypothetical protein [Saprospirales bacterium]
MVAVLPLDTPLVAEQEGQLVLSQEYIQTQILHLRSDDRVRIHPETHGQWNSLEEVPREYRPYVVRK